MTPLKRFKNLILIDKQDIYQIFLYSIIAGLISLSLPLGIQSIINFIQAGKVSTSWIVLVGVVVIGVAVPCVDPAAAIDPVDGDQWPIRSM